MKSKWWREPREPSSACLSAEEFRSRVGEYTMRRGFEIRELAMGVTQIDERYAFDQVTQSRILELQVQLMMVLERGRIVPRDDVNDPAFQRLMAGIINAR